MRKINFNDIVNQKVGFCGIDGNCFCLVIDSGRVAFEAMENPDDGYRSMLDEVVQVPIVGHNFFKRQVVDLIVKPVDNGVCKDEDNGYNLVDVNGHAWLAFGTNWDDHYYPVFYFTYNPPLTYELPSEE